MRIVHVSSVAEFEAQVRKNIRDFKAADKNIAADTIPRIAANKNGLYGVIIITEEFRDEFEKYIVGRHRVARTFGNKSKYNLDGVASYRIIEGICYRAFLFYLTATRNEEKQVLIEGKKKELFRYIGDYFGNNAHDVINAIIEKKPIGMYEILPVIKDQLNYLKKATSAEVCDFLMFVNDHRLGKAGEINNYQGIRICHERAYREVFRLMPVSLFN